MGYNKQWENYTEKYQKLCMENDVIPDSDQLPFSSRTGTSGE